MAPTHATAPDLDRGYILNGDENRWVTDVQAVLRQEGAQESTAYLSHECRAERVPFSETYLGGGDDIFQSQEPWEFLTYSQNGVLYQTIALGLGESENFAGQDHVLPPVTPVGRHTWPNVDERPIVEHAVDELLQRLQAGQVSVRDLFLRVSWQDASRRFTLYAPCRYLNFSNPEKQQSRYIQPISGYVLYPHENYGDYFIPAYVAAAMHADGRGLTEFCLRNYRHIPSYFAERLNGVDPALLPGAYMPADDLIIRVEAECSVYSYLPG